MREKSSGVILRAGQGSWIDKKFKEFRIMADGVIPFGTYWYYDNNHAPKRQAELYASAIMSNAGTLGAWLDLEDSRPAPYLNYKYWYDFCEYFRQLLPNVQLGIYTRASYFNQYVPRNNMYFSQYPLWVAHYGAIQPDLPHAWSDWLMWQYSDHGDGVSYGVGSKEIDMNYSKLDINSIHKRHLLAYFGDRKVEYIVK